MNKENIINEHGNESNYALALWFKRDCQCDTNNSKYRTHVNKESE